MVVVVVCFPGFILSVRPYGLLWTEPCPLCILNSSTTLVGSILPFPIWSTSFWLCVAVSRVDFFNSGIIRTNYANIRAADALIPCVSTTSTAIVPIYIIKRFLDSRIPWLRISATFAHVNDDVVKWKHFPRYCPFVRGIHRSPVNSPYKGQWRGALMFSLICAWIKVWLNSGESGDLRRHRAHYDVNVMIVEKCVTESFCFLKKIGNKGLIHCGLVVTQYRCMELRQHWFS